LTTVSAQPFEHPIGFAPSEISSSINRIVVSQHAEEAAFLWTRRNRAVHEPHYSLDDLAALDERVEAHLDGLRISGDVGWRYCNASMAAALGPGESFALGALAFGAGDRDRMRETLFAACSSPAAVPGLVSALGWLAYESVAQWIGILVEAKSPAHRAVGIAASAIHGQDPGVSLAAAVTDLDPALCARALRALGELKRRDLVNQARAQLRSSDDGCRFWAAWALTLNGEREGLSELTQWFERGDSVGPRALRLGLRAMKLDESRKWISELARKPELGPAAVMGAGIVGDPMSIPWLIRRMESVELARLAGEAFMMITGVDLAYHDLNQDTPTPEGATEAPFQEVLELNYESNLPWPSPSRIEQWWQENHKSFASGTRYLAGRAITEQSARNVLVTGKQRQREAAALELALLNPGEILFEVRARGNWQQSVLASWNS
jgi:uncharacterized protein (TIGR02270 family)